MKYGNAPVIIGQFIDQEATEIMAYQYMCITRAHSYSRISLDPRLSHHYSDLISMVFEDFIKLKNDPFALEDYYIYITAKTGYTSPESPINRPGWHCDGFMSDDVNYIWSDVGPTEFLVLDELVDITQDHMKSIDEFNELHLKSPNRLYVPPLYSVLRLDQSMIHRVSCRLSGMHSFVKISISKQKYNLIGNTINYSLNYSDWNWVERNIERNHPSK